MSDHALSIKVMRLQAPDLHLNSSATLQSLNDLDTTISPNYEGITSTMTLPTSFGNVYLGQIFTAIVTVSNTSPLPVKLVAAKIELTTDRSRFLLHDTIGAPLPVLNPGDRQEILLKHEIKELGQHTLLCTSSYFSDTEGEKRYQPQAFKFSTALPLVVRTKHRTVGERVSLEATLENRTTEAMLLESVKMLPSPHFTSVAITTTSTSSTTSIDNSTSTATPTTSKEQHTTSSNKGGGPLDDYITSLPLLSPNTGSTSFIFHLTRKTHNTTSPSPQATTATATLPNLPKDDGSLGRLEIRWRGRLGESARLQTQTVSLGPPNKELRISVSHLPEPVYGLKPFIAKLTVRSTADRVMGPLRVALTPAAVKGVCNIAMEGAQAVVVEEIKAGGSVDVELKLVGLEVGSQVLQGILVVGENDGRVYDTLQPVDVYIHV